MERLKHMKDALLCCVESQMSHLNTVDTKELGEAIDMIKDLEEAIYYATITKAMKEQDDEGSKYSKWQHEENGQQYYGGGPYPPPIMYYGGDGNGKHNGNWNNQHQTPMEHHEKEGSTYDPRMEGKSGRTRRQYMDAKHKHVDSATQMRELEKYMSELSDDILEMIEDATPEERQYLSKKVATLATKLEAVN